MAVPVVRASASCCICMPPAYSSCPGCLLSLLGFPSWLCLLSLSILSVVLLCSSFLLSLLGEGLAQQVLAWGVPETALVRAAYRHAREDQCGLAGRGGESLRSIWVLCLGSLPCSRLAAPGCHAAGRSCSLWELGTLRSLHAVCGHGAGTCCLGSCWSAVDVLFVWRPTSLCLLVCGRDSSLSVEGHVLLMCCLRLSSWRCVGPCISVQAAGSCGSSTAISSPARSGGHERLRLPIRPGRAASPA